MTDEVALYSSTPALAKIQVQWGACYVNKAIGGCRPEVLIPRYRFHRQWSNMTEQETTSMPVCRKEDERMKQRAYTCNLLGVAVMNTLGNTANRPHAIHRHLQIVHLAEGLDYTTAHYSRSSRAG